MNNTLNALFQSTVSKYGTKAALRYKEKKAFHDITYAELAQRVETLASGFAALGVVKGDRVALLSENRPEWVTTDLAALSLGAVIVPLYPTLPAPQIAYIVRNSGAKVLVVENAKQAQKAAEARKEAPDLQYVVVMEGETAAAGTGGETLTYAQVVERGTAQPLGAEKYAALWQGVQESDIASFVYTSGTTGDPKGVMLSHKNFVWDVDAALQHYGAGGEVVTDRDTFLSFLPLSHAYERTTGYYLPFRVGATIGYSEGVRTLADDMAQIQPTIMVCVPRVYESFQERAVDRMAKEPEDKQKIFDKAIAVGKEIAQRKSDGKGAGLVLGSQHLVYEKLVYEKARARFGGRLRFLVSGGAALRPDTALFFAAIGIPISEGYGMTESAPFMCTNPVNRTKIGTVGTVAPGAEFKIAGDGEILYRGPNVMQGYWGKPDATQEVLDADGWLHTGDVGVLDADGYLKITDRKKDILVLGNGKNVAPQPIESAIKESPFISEIVLIGDQQSIITALVLPAKSKLADWAKTENLAFADEDALLKMPEAKRKIKQEIDAYSKHLADYEKIKKFALLGATFSIESGELTPSLKVKRKVVMQKFAREIAEMRGGGGADGAEG